MPNNRISKKEEAIISRNKALLNEAYEAEKNNTKSPLSIIEVRTGNNPDAKKASTKVARMPDEGKKRKQQEDVERNWSTIWDKNPSNAMTQAQPPYSFRGKNLENLERYKKYQAASKIQKVIKRPLQLSLLKRKYDAKEALVKGKTISNLKKMKR